MSPESLPLGGSGLKGNLLRRRGASRRGKGLAGVAKAVSRQVSCRGSPLSPFCSSWSWPWRRPSSLELRSYPGSPPLPCLVWWCPWLRLLVHSYRGTKSVPLFFTPTGAPGPGPHISAMRCWARPKNGARAGGAVFTAVSFLRALRSPRLPRVARHGEVGVTWAACVGLVSARMRHVVVKGRFTPSP